MSFASRSTPRRHTATRSPSGVGVQSPRTAFGWLHRNEPPHAYLQASYNVWQHLRAWEGVSFASTELSFGSRRDEASSGWVTSERVSRYRVLQHHLHIAVGTAYWDARATLVHEMAHVVTAELGYPDEHHGSNFRRIERAAAEEILGRPLPAEASETCYGLVLALSDAFHTAPKEAF